MYKLKKLFSAATRKVSGSSIAKASLAFLLSLGFIGLAQAAGGDLLSAAADPVKSTFGSDSTFAKWLILAEVIVGVIMYIRTKNMMLLMGAIVVVVATTVGYTLVGF